VSESELGVCAKVAKLEGDLSKCVRNEETIKLLLGQLELDHLCFDLYDLLLTWLGKSPMHKNG